MKKRVCGFFLCVCMIVTMLAGCGSDSSIDTEADDENEVVVSTEKEDVVYPSTQEQEETEETIETEEAEQKIYRTLEKVEVRVNSNDFTAGSCTDEAILSQFISGNSNGPSITQFLNSSMASSGVSSLSKLKNNYSFYMNQSRGRIDNNVVDYSISYDGNTYKLISIGEEYELVVGMKIAGLYKAGFKSNDTSRFKDMYSYCVMVFEMCYDASSKGYHWKPVALLPASSCMEYSFTLPN